MFSVEDLLIAHGYKLSTNTSDSYQKKSDRCHHESVQRRSGRGPLNGYETDSGVHSLDKNAPGKGYCSDNEVKLGSQVKQSIDASFAKDKGGVATVQASEVGLYGTVPLRWSSRPKTDKDIAYWRRRGQDFSALLAYDEKGETKTKESTAKVTLSYDRYEPGTVQEYLLEVGKGTRNVAKNDILEERSKAPECNTETVTYSTKSQKQMPNNDGGKTIFQDSCTIRLDRNELGSEYAEKSHSLPRVLLPDTMRHVDLSMVATDNCRSRVKNVTPYPENKTHLDLNENSGTWNNLPKPKYSRPTKPPSYQLHQKTRGTIEKDGVQEEKQTDGHNQYTTNISELKDNFYIQDSGMEPPVYVPPPSYKSPSDQNLNDVPYYGTHFSGEQHQHWEESRGMKQQLCANNRGAEGEGCTDNHIQFKKEKHGTQLHDFASSVQYIPFDDPRIKHIKVGHDEGLQYNAKEINNTSLNRYPLLQNKDMKDRHHAGAFLGPQNMISSVSYGTADSNSIDSSKYADASFKCKESHHSLDPRMHEVVPQNHDTKNKVSSQKEHSNGACENVAQVKRFEPENEIQCKVSTRKKKNETIFCLVSVPVTAMPFPSDIDKNNNDLTQSKEQMGTTADISAAVQEQRSVNSSPTEWELQAHATRMTSNSGLQDQHKQEEHKQTDDLRFINPRKHRELRYSGSWPGDHSRDQQSQTIFPQEVQNSSCFSGTKLNKHTDTSLPPNEMPSVPLIWSKKPTDVCIQNTSGIKVQAHLKQSIHSAFSRTMSCDSNLLKPKAHLRQQNGPSFVNTIEKEKNNVTKGEVVKGESLSSCNSKEPFGQFLLKPANRRPCDAIGELEFLNKELQERESDQNENSVENEEGQQQQQVLAERLNYEMTGESNMCQSKPKIEVQRVPKRQVGRVKCKSESWSNDLESNNSQINLGFELSQPTLGSKKQFFSSLDENVVREIQIGDLEAEKKKKNEFIFCEKPAPPHRLSKSYSLNAKETKRHHPIVSFWETCKDQLCFDDVLLDSDKKATDSPKQNLVENRTNIQLSSASRNQDPFEKDFRSFTIDGNLQIDRKMAEKVHEIEETLEIPENESLEVRAVRILGIEVGVGSFSEGAPPDHHVDSEVNFLPHEYSERETKQDPSQNAYVESYKSSSNDNCTSKGEVNISSKSFSQAFTFLKFTESNDVHRSTKNDQVELKLEHEQEHDGSVFCHSIPFPITQKKAVTPNSEIKSRSTSKIIETLQEKLASSPKRTGMDRLVRMTEVHSVSRMRRLSIKRSDSGDEADDEKEPLKAEEEEGSKHTFVSNEILHKVTSQGNAVCKRVISLDERANVTTKSRKKFEDEIFYLDSYDPTRVERV
ncbi:junctional cadherin 5-associated protein [Ambystoma mexicanum]|uniref:junctional cadherin 5-associated protein n=1 Tax=Ambystoma mexicanum TaxID=8296 RepID=UPI0037E75487